MQKFLSEAMMTMGMCMTMDMRIFSCVLLRD